MLGVGNFFRFSEHLRQSLASQSHKSYSATSGGSKATTFAKCPTKRSRTLASHRRIARSGSEIHVPSIESVQQGIAPRRYSGCLSIVNSASAATPSQVECTAILFIGIRSGIDLNEHPAGHFTEKSRAALMLEHVGSHHDALGEHLRVQCAKLIEGLRDHHAIITRHISRYTPTRLVISNSRTVQRRSYDTSPFIQSLKYAHDKQDLI
ncbi:hypothetical protein B0G69_6949 [Paraburkholderia sp. RAU2J]|nr:hypothetical protein B0G69_6949 [Paraburkholderia sp. RAU2J]